MKNRTCYSREGYRPGFNLLICDICGFRFYSDEVRENSDGLLVCMDDWEPEHPLDYMVEARPERITPRKVRTEGTPTYQWQVDGSSTKLPLTLPFTLA